jgi:hypothetical protein
MDLLLVNVHISRAIGSASSRESDGVVGGDYQPRRQLSGGGSIANLQTWGRGFHVGVGAATGRRESSQSFGDFQVMGRYGERVY